MKSTVTLALSLGLASGCGHTPMQEHLQRSGKPAQATVADVPVCGYQVELELNDLPPSAAGDAAERRRTPKKVSGELLAVQDGVLVVLEEKSGVQRVPASSVKQVSVQVFSHQAAGAAAGFILLGPLISISNGFFIVFTGPLWIITAAGATAKAMSKDTADTSATDVALLQFARFPQGLPPDWLIPGVAPPACPRNPPSVKLEAKPERASSTSTDLPRT